MRWVSMVVVLIGCGRVNFDLANSTVTDADVVDAAVTGYSRIIASDQTTCAIFRGRAYCWGRGTNNEIGDGAGVNRLVPTLVALPAGTVTDIAQGEGHGCAIVDDAAYCWGSAPPGNGLPASAMPVAVAGLPSPVTSISAGGGFSCAVAGGTAYCWGDDSSGRLGNGGLGDTMTPMPVVGLPQPVSAIDAANDHAVALLVDGSVWSWGHNDSGSLCTGSFVPDNTDTPVQSLVTGALPALAGWHACMLVAGSVTCWGRGTAGELGDGASSDSPTPVAVSGLGSFVTALATGGGPTNLDASCAVVFGDTWCWGAGRFGRLGNSSEINEGSPVRMLTLPPDTVELALAYDHTCARASDGTVRCWGRGDGGQLGDGRGMNDFVPVVVALPAD